MTGPTYAVLVLVMWVSLGTLAVIVFLTHHGRRSWPWFIIGAVLGPILLPIAAEFDRRTDRLARWRSHGPTAATPGLAEPMWLVGVDGSVESDDAIREVSRMTMRARPGVLLMTVLDPDIADAARVASAEAMLRDRATWLEDSPGSVICEVASGDPAQVLMDRADQDDIELVVVGRRAKGPSHRLLGSVADQLVRRSTRPVLLGAADGHRVIRSAPPLRRSS